ncbi:hypothetical protein Cgig2_026000 [Carnegiea gigantea]|uniref:Endonuclease/exonuclease/phosphatase domain-containing protein n=1 Tax=Carnegiea gigantea TaxID=171969 RepID=A0A9Q1K2I1_9CARY|nr:hypothetical protein Cgig2_026000 [Carnegiea gigantea]
MVALLETKVKKENIEGRANQLTVMSTTNQVVHCKATQSIQGPWCVMGDFNSVLHPRERIWEGGEDIHHVEIRDFSQCLRVCDLQEVRSTGAFVTWTNKTVWSKIDRVVANSIWHMDMGYTHVQHLTEGLFDHTPLKINFPHCQSRKSIFRFCEMWTFDPIFKGLVAQHCSP